MLKLSYYLGLKKDILLIVYVLVSVLMFVSTKSF